LLSIPEKVDGLIVLWALKAVRKVGTSFMATFTQHEENSRQLHTGIQEGRICVKMCAPHAFFTLI